MNGGDVLTHLSISGRQQVPNKYLLNPWDQSWRGLAMAFCSNRLDPPQILQGHL